MIAIFWKVLSRVHKSLRVRYKPLGYMFERPQSVFSNQVFGVVLRM